MNRLDLHVLQQIKNKTCVTITLPTHRAAPENKQDPIRLKNLVKQAMERLADGALSGDLDALKKQLDQLMDDLDYRNMQDGLALFASPDFSRAIYLPFVLKERVVVGDSFFTRDLVFAMNRTPRFWVLVLSEKPTRLYEGLRNELTEVQDGGFPLIHEGPGGEEPLPGGFGIQKSAYRDERHRQFFRQVDEALKPFLATDPLPLVAVGVDRYLAFFDEVTSNKDSILTTLKGSHDKTSPYELAKLIWPLVEDSLNQTRTRIVSELEKAISERKFVSTVGEVWRLANEGRGRILLVEEGFHFPARIDETGRTLIPDDNTDAQDVMEDAVDRIIETVLEKQGQVVFMDDGQLELHRRIALILRY